MTNAYGTCAQSVRRRDRTLRQEFTSFPPPAAGQTHVRIAVQHTQGAQQALWRNSRLGFKRRGRLDKGGRWVVQKQDGTFS